MLGVNYSIKKAGWFSPNCNSAKFIETVAIVSAESKFISNSYDLAVPINSAALPDGSCQVFFTEYVRLFSLCSHMLMFLFVYDLAGEPQNGIARGWKMPGLCEKIFWLLPRIL